MLCTFCGTENRPENKFCGMCGVRLERRKAERRVRQDSLRCSSCGHANEQGHKFCGMCGSRVDRRVRERRAESPDQPRATAMANAQLPTPETPSGQSVPAPPVAVAAQPEEAHSVSVDEVLPHPKTQPAIFREEPPHVATIGGPSFLGLGDEPQNPSDYLLEDEGSSGGVLRRLVLIAILAAIAGLVFVGWRSSSRANPKSAPPPITQPTASPSPQSKDTDQESVPDSAQGAKNSDSSQTDAAKGANDASADAEASPSATKVESGENKTLESASEKTPTLARKASRESPEAGAAAQHRPSSTLLLAQQYLQGRGVKQNCEQGLMYLKAATQKNEPAAAVQMGALYASGHCVQRNQVTAYRWFTSAHELDPANPWIQTNLDQLWAQMSPQERQQVAR
jgi:hypothetical protein